MICALKMKPIESDGKLMGGTDEVGVWHTPGTMSSFNALSPLQNYTKLEKKLEKLQWLANKSHDFQST